MKNSMESYRGKEDILTKYFRLVNNVMDNSIEGYREKKNVLQKYVKQIDKLRTENKKEELEKLLNNVINLLPENVKSLSIPVTSSNGEIEFITMERESNVPEEEQKNWDISDLIAYSVREESLINREEDED